MGNEPAQNRRGNQEICGDMEGTLRRMKKTILTLIQVSVTVGMLWWVFHDPVQRHAMREALHKANYGWVGLAILAYFLVEIAAAIRWQILLRVQKIHLTLPRISGLFLIGMFYNQVLPGG